MRTMDEAGRLSIARSAHHGCSASSYGCLRWRRRRVYHLAVTARYPRRSAPGPAGSAKAASPCRHRRGDRIAGATPADSVVTPWAWRVADGTYPAAGRALFDGLAGQLALGAPGLARRSMKRMRGCPVTAVLSLVLRVLVCAADLHAIGRCPGLCRLLARQAGHDGGVRGIHQDRR